MTEVSLSGIRKFFGKSEVIPPLDLHIENGEFVVLVGPSGCGKSTLLRMIAGLESSDEGDLTIAGKRANDLSPKERNIAMVFQNYALYPHMTVRQNMAFSLRLARAEKALIEEHIQKASAILGLKPLLDRLPRQLSGGQRQRVAMGRAIVRNPSVFLFDEPLSNLDAKLRVQMRAEIRGLHDRLSATTIYVTHDQVEAMTMADKIVVLRDGHVEQAGSPMDLYSRPANLFVATFLGSPEMNLLSASSNEIDIELATGPKPRGGSQRDKASSGDMTIGIRPHDITIQSAEGAKTTAIVSLVERTGSETLIRASFPSGNTVCAVMPGEIAVSAGERVGLRFNSSRLHYFDSKTGEALTA